MSRRFVTKEELNELSDEELYDVLWRCDPNEYKKMVRRMDAVHIRALQKVFIRSDFPKELEMALKVFRDKIEDEAA